MDQIFPPVSNIELKFELQIDENIVQQCVVQKGYENILTETEATMQTVLGIEDIHAVTELYKECSE